MATKSAYQLPPVANRYAGIMVSLARMQWPDMSRFDDPEIVWQMHKEHHVGLIVSSDSQARVLELLDKYVDIVHNEYHAAVPMTHKPSS
jgi:hypothetical protein